MDEKKVIDSLQVAASNGDADIISHMISQGIDLETVDDNQNTALMYAAKAGKIKVLNLLIEHRVNLNEVNINGETALLCAVKAAQNQAVLILGCAGSHLDIRDYDGEDALMCASRQGGVEMVKILLDLKASVNVFNNEGKSAIGIAYEAGNIDVIKSFHQNGNLDNLTDFHENTLLILAARKGDVDLVDFLVHTGVNLNAKNKNEFTSLIAAAENHHLDIVQILTKARAQLDLTNKYGDTALTIACRNGNMLIVKHLIDEGASLEEGGKVCVTPLMQAAFHGQLDVMVELLNNGANVNACNVDGDTALMTLCFSQCDRIHEACHILVQHGTDINHLDCNGVPALIKAILYKRILLAQTFIALGADIEFVMCNTRLRRKETPLIMATRMGQTEVVKCLLRHKAEVNAMDRYQMTALDTAVSGWDDKNKDDSSLISLLIQAGGDIAHVDSNGMTPLMTACSNGLVFAVRCLIEAGALLNCRHFILGHTALYFAVMNGFCDVVELLMRAGAEVRSEFHVAIFAGKKEMVRTMLLNGALPTCQNMNDYNAIFPKAPISPFFIALLKNHFSIARYLGSVWCFNQFDIINLTNHKTLQDAVKTGRMGNTKDLLDNLSIKPRPLVVLSFVAVSCALGFDSGRAEKVDSLNLPNVFKRRLMYQDDAARLPAKEWRNIIFP